MKHEDNLQAMIDHANTKLTTTQEAEHREKVLVFVARMGATFVSEICWETGISEYNVKPALYSLEKDELIERIQVHPFLPDIRLAARVHDQSARGQGGFENFSRKRWFGITKKGLESELLN